jgi:RhtB (resistance to homoserine/threonine) family protein
MHEFLSISILIILAAISPGPDFAMVTKNSLLFSRRAGIYTALGVSVSLLIHGVYCILGLAIIISRSLLAFSIIKYLGAAYLIYIGIKGILSKKESIQIEEKHSNITITAWHAFCQGLLCNLLNPKAVVFLLAFFTLIIKPGSSLLYEMGYGLEIAIIHMIWFTCLSMMMTHKTVKKYLSRIQFYIVKIMGAALIAFGVRIATLSQAVMPTIAL